MKAVTCPRYGSPDDLELRVVRDPEPDRGEVLIRVHAAGLNAADYLIVRGAPPLIRLTYGLCRPKITAPGADVAGVVIACGPGVERLAPGDEVIANLFGCGMGGYAQLDRVYLTESMPKTRTGKTMRRLLRDFVVHGKPTGDTSAVEDLSALDVVANAVRE